jgi:hypothetical protein
MFSFPISFAGFVNTSQQKPPVLRVAGSLH